MQGAGLPVNLRGPWGDPSPRGGRVPRGRSTFPIAQPGPSQEDARGGHGSPRPRPASHRQRRRGALRPASRTTPTDFRCTFHVHGVPEGILPHPTLTRTIATRRPTLIASDAWGRI